MGCSSGGSFLVGLNWWLVVFGFWFGGWVLFSVIVAFVGC